MQFYTDADLSPRQALTPEGYLVARDTVIARCGRQVYHETELPDVTGDAAGWINVDRDADEVFDPVSIASLAGAEVRRIGAGWDSPAGSTRNDPTTHIPLAIPIGNEPPPQPRLKLVPPTETELRATLAQAKAARDLTAATLADAEAAADRARHRVARCTERLDSFVTLDAQITKATVAALRSGDGLSHGGMAEEHRQRVSDRGHHGDHDRGRRRQNPLTGLGPDVQRCDRPR